MNTTQYTDMQDSEGIKAGLLMMAQKRLGVARELHAAGWANRQFLIFQKYAPTLVLEPANGRFRPVGDPSVALALGMPEESARRVLAHGVLSDVAVLASASVQEWAGIVADYYEEMIADLEAAEGGAA